MNQVFVYIDSFHEFEVDDVAQDNVPIEKEASPPNVPQRLQKKAQWKQQQHKFGRVYGQPCKKGFH